MSRRDLRCGSPRPSPARPCQQARSRGGFGAPRRLAESAGSSLDLDVVDLPDRPVVVHLGEVGALAAREHDLGRPEAADRRAACRRAPAPPPRPCSISSADGTSIAYPSIAWMVTVAPSAPAASSTSASIGPVNSTFSPPIGKSVRTVACGSGRERVEHRTPSPCANGDVVEHEELVLRRVDRTAVGVARPRR